MKLTPNIIEAVIHQESRGKAKATSPKGAQGLMQLMPATALEIAQELGETYIPYDPQQNIRFGTYYLQKQLDRFGDLRLALAAYNAGPGWVSRLRKQYGNAFEDIQKYLPKETQNYVAKITARIETTRDSIRIADTHKI
jgi:soluble lytic murein transglycosylase-like protein